MINLIRFFLDRPLMVKLAFVGVMLFGLYSMATIRKEGFPAVETNVINVTTIYPGASAEDVELNVTTPLEEEITEVDGIQEYTSVSQENSSLIVIQADEGASPGEMMSIVADIQQAVDQTRDLPATDLDGLPSVTAVSTGDTPIISIDFFGEHRQLRQILPMIELDLEAIDGVSGVDKVGYFDREIHIEIDPVKARAARVSFGDVVKAIGARNLRVTGGTLESYLNERTVVTLNKFKTPQEVSEVILRSSITGQRVRVGDVAQVVVREKDEQLVVRNNGREGMSLVVRKKVKADIINTLDRVKAYMAGRDLPEGVGFSYSNDQSARTRLRLQVLSGNAIMGFVLVAVILLFSLNWRSAMWTAVGVPFSLLGAFILVPYFGVTINVVSLAGFVLVLGLLVDDAIVVAERITYYREHGLSGHDAAMRGTSDMWKPVFVASLTTVLAFSPMFSIGGLPGKFAWAIPAVVIVALIASLAESFLILPGHLAGGKQLKEKGKPGWILSLEYRYGELLERLLHRRYLLVGVMALLLIASIGLVKVAMKTTMFPQEGVETFYIKLQMPRGASLQATETRLKEIEQYLAALPDEELESFATRAGHMSTNSTKNRGDHTNWGIISVYLTGEARRSRSADTIIEQLRSTINAGPEQSLLFDKQRIGPPIGKPIEVRISTNDDALRKQVADELMAFLAEQKGASDLESDDRPGKDQLVVDLDYERLAEVGLTVQHVAEALRVGFDGMIVSSTTSVDETLEYRVIMEPSFRGNPDMIYQIPVTNPQGQVLTLRDVLRLREASGPLEFRHVNGIRTETLYGDLDPKVLTTAELERRARERFGQSWAQHPQLKVNFAGEAREAKKIFGGFLAAGIMALILIYITVALLLNSLAQPLIVMVAIPFAVVGVIWAFFAHGMPLSFFSTMGTLGLIGVVVNDSIIMVTESNRELAENPQGNLVRTIVDGAKRRLRPVMLTTATTVVGLLPTAYGIGGKDALIMPLTLAMAYGLIFGTTITLLLVPALLAIGHDVAHALGRGSEHARGR